MPTAPVNEDGAVLYYEDTGPPAGSDMYTTLVLVHGAGFHCASFGRMKPFAAKYNIRLIIPNLRDYPGSTPYTQEELDELRGPEPERLSKALKARALELAAFLKWVIETEKIPPRQHAETSELALGGIAVLSWSAGNCQTMAFFAHPDQLPDETRKLLDSYLRGYILFEPSLSSTGGFAPEGLRAVKASREPSMSLEDTAQAFSLSVSAYYPPFTFPDVIEPVPMYSPRRALADDPRYTPTTSRMTAEELRATMRAEVIDTGSSQNLFMVLDRAVYRANMERALLDRRLSFGHSGEEVWPALRVHVVWCDMSVGDCIWAAVYLHFRHAAAPPESRRPMKVHKLEGENHFVHWEEPERFVKMLAGII